MLLAALLLLAPAAQRTVVTVDDAIPAQPRYSQAVAFTAHLALEDGTPVAGDDATLCASAGQPCRLQIFVAPDGASPATFLVDPAVAHDGTAGARIPFVDGALNANVTYAAAPDGAPYTVTVKFLGTGAGAATGNPDCAPGAADSGSTGLCPSEASFPVDLFTEQSSIELGQALEAALSLDDCDPADATSCNAPLACEPTKKKCGLVLSADVTDPNGDAPPGGTDVDGAGPKHLQGVDVSFFYDVNENGRPEANESLGVGTTNQAGVASTIFVLDPAFVHAGTYDDGIIAEFGGDEHYGVARGSARLIVHPADVDVARTVIEATPESVPADGVSKVTLRVRLVDKFNNLLDASSDPHDVLFASTLGRLEGAGTRDELDGTYTTVLDAGRHPGTAVVSVTIDGQAGPTKNVEITGGPGGCTCAATDQAPLALSFAGLLFFLRRRR